MILHLSHLCEFFFSILRVRHTEKVCTQDYIVYLPAVNLPLGEKLEYRKGCSDRVTHRNGTKI